MGKNQENASEGSIFSAYDNKVHYYGRVTMALALATMFLPVLGVALRYQVAIDWAEVAGATGGILAAFGLNGLVEPFTFAPVLGAGATYMAFTTGNVGQMKVPCVVNSQGIMGVEAGTKEGDVVATLAVGVSTLVSTIMVALAMVFVTIIYPVLSHPVIAPGINNVMAALFGALGVMIFMKDPKVASVPYLVGAVIAAVMGVGWFNAQALWMMLLLIVIAVVWTYQLFKKGALKK